MIKCEFALLHGVGGFWSFSKMGPLITIRAQVIMQR
jgi:hypothetical protein